MRLGNRKSSALRFDWAIQAATDVRRPAHRPFRGLSGVHSRYGLHTRAVTVYRDMLSEGFSHFVTSMTAPVASGWSGRRVGFTPTGKRRLFTAHAISGPMHCNIMARRFTVGCPRRSAQIRALRASVPLASLAKQSEKIHSAFSSLAEDKLAEGKFRLGEQIVSDEAEVREASRQFYAALNRMANGDAGPLADIWSHGAAVTTMHPIGGRQVGWDKVRGSFGQVAKLASEGKVKLANQIIHVAGDMAYELGVERGQLKLAGQKVSISDRVTNVYRREAGTWKIVHHHTDIAQAMIDVLSRLKKKKKKK